MRQRAGRLVARAFSGLEESPVSGKVLSEASKSNMTIKKRCHRSIDLPGSHKALTRHKSFHQIHRMGHRPAARPQSWSLPEAGRILGEPAAPEEDLVQDS